MRVLVTRPQPDAGRTATRLADLGHEVIVDPLLTIEPLPITELPHGPFDAVAVTSANAVRASAALGAFDSLRSIPLYAVGPHTADAARGSLFEKVVVANGDATSLAQMLSARLAPGARVLHLAGEDRARDLAGLLSRAGIEVKVVTLYRARPSAAFAPATVGALFENKVDAVLHFSPRSAATFAELVDRHGLRDAARKARHLCLSRAVAERLSPLGVTSECAAIPTEAELVGLLRP
jgi:uroporphyrinogen-III synthase